MDLLAQFRRKSDCGMDDLRLIAKGPVQIMIRYFVPDGE